MAEISKWVRRCGCIIDADETGSGVKLCDEHAKQAEKLNTAPEIEEFLKKLSTPEVKS